MKKRVISLLLAAALGLTAALTSCSSRPEPERSRVTHVYKSTDVSLPDNISTSTGAMYLMGSELLIRATEVLDEGPYEDRAQAENARRDVMVKLDIGTGDYTLDPIPKPGDGRYINSILPITDGGYLIVINNYDEEKGTQQFSVESWDGSTFTVLSDNVQALFEANPEELEFGFGDFYIQYIQMDDDGNIYLATDSLLGVFDASMKKLFEIELPGWIDTLGQSGDGRVFIQYYDRQNGGQVLRYVDPAKKDFGENVEVPADNRFRNATFYNGRGYDMYINDGQSVWGYNVGSEPVELLNWINSDIIADGIRDLAIVDENTFIANYYEYSEEGSIRELYILERVPDEEVPERYVIDLAVKYMEYDLPSKVVKFNRANDEYRVRITDYEQYNTDEDYQAGDTKLYNDIQAGTGPDIVSLANFSNSAVLIDEGIFADLYEFMDKDNFDRSLLFDCVLEPFEVKGELPQLVTMMNLRTLAAKSANVPGESWTVDEFLDWAESLPEGKFLMDYTDQMSMLNALICCSINQFIDADSGKVDFDNATFRRLLEYAKNTTDFNYRATLSGDDLADYDMDRYRAYREDTVLLNEAYLYDLSAMVDAMFAFGFEDTAFIGYPAADGGSGVVALPSTSYAILDDSPVAEGAWEFVKSMLSVDQTQRGGMHGIPANREAFRAAAEEDMKMHYFYRYDGGRSGSSSDDFIGRYDESQGIYRDFTEADVTRMEALIDSAIAVPSYAEKFVELAMEDLEMYFAGEKSLDETISVIQSRVGLYIAENS